jgi:hypothetical protein
MKTLPKLLVLIIITITSKVCVAQDFDYLEYNPVWHVRSICSYGYPCVVTSNYNYYLNGDTTINDLDYKILVQAGLSEFSWFANPPVGAGCSGSDVIENIPLGFLRTEDKKMFFLPSVESQEVLLYDFNLEIGSTLPVSYVNLQEDVYVTSIDIISTPFGNLKRFGLSNSWSDYLIEGIGHSKGFLEPLSISLECGYELMCYSMDDESYFPESGLSCMLVSGLAENSAKSDLLNIYPNPTYQATNILTGHSMVNGSVRIYNTQGQIALERRGLAGENLNINNLQLDAGLYIVQVYEGQRLMGSDKLIILE